MEMFEPKEWCGKALEVSAPGRICLFGEHQDYLGLPVIASAINLRIVLRAIPIAPPVIRLHLPDINKQRTLRLNEENPYLDTQDYLAAAINILVREGVRWENGYEVLVRSDIPINSGASSSSALQVAWCAFLLASAGDPRAHDPVEIAKAAYQSEVVEFKAPGGMMDHFSSALGGVIWLDTRPPYHFKRLTPHIGEFLLVDSGIPKDTTGVLAHRRKALESLNFSFEAWKTSGYPPVKVEDLQLTGEEAPALFRGTVDNALLTVAARELLAAPPVDQKRLGELLYQHHSNLANLINVSHPVIDELLDLGMKHGALGGKINGSGCGGSFFLLAPGKGEELRAFYRQHRNLRSWVVSPSEGVSITPIMADYISMRWPYESSVS